MTESAVVALLMLPLAEAPPRIGRYSLSEDMKRR